MSNTISAQGWTLSGEIEMNTSYNIALIGTVPKISGKVEKVELKIPFSAGVNEPDNYTDEMYPFFFKDASQLTYNSSYGYYENEAYNGVIYYIGERALQLLTPATIKRELSSGGTRVEYITNTLTFTRNELTELGKDASNWVGEVYFAIDRQYAPVYHPTYRPYYIKRKSTLTIYYSPNNIKYGVNGEWVDCVPYYGVNGEWRQVEVSLGLNNEWVR